jgi:hypothetical protein
LEQSEADQPINYSNKGVHQRSGTQNQGEACISAKLEAQIESEVHNGDFQRHAVLGITG